MELGRLVQKLLRMGCVCIKPSILVEGVRYKVIRQIAEGGFSTVELVEDSRTGKRYAMKRITCHSIEDQNQAKREVEITRQFDHPNMVRVVGAAVQGSADILHGATSEVLIVMPLYCRGSLADELERRQLTGEALAQPALLSIFHGVCLAVRELHTSSPPLAHRDIKPHNVLLTNDLQPVLMDFGSAALARVQVGNHREAQYLQDTAAEQSSMCYRPPELHQVQTNTTLDERTDIWSLGLLLYALMFFQSPYEVTYERGDSVALAVQSGKISFPENKLFSPALLQLVTEMTNVDIGFRIRIDSVIEKLDLLMRQNPDQL